MGSCGICVAYGVRKVREKRGPGRRGVWFGTSKLGARAHALSLREAYYYLLCAGQNENGVLCLLPVC